eukprot:CAMPEP_0170620138 /NCGR_PEP_ID=MMETSP0224-20130122/27897_1 /TAXON_ID=285029 /ORGANISM="Togula jolla, Strain CCCM 725" /LENGTH=342 /DNA_ID=CAMNT_0010946289 /DNA_START=41 /DNA_END=1069 /DNA_ORIENTATION=-
MPQIAKTLHLARRPDATGEFADDMFVMKESDIGEPADKEVIVRVDVLSCDPTQRIWATDIPQYMPKVEIGEPMRSLFGGTVIASSNPDWAVGDRVTGFGAWSTHLKADPKTFGWNKVAEGTSMQMATACILCPTTAYVGLHKFGKVKAGETLFVNAAAGATGSVVVQLGKAAGARVIASAGGAKKCAYVKSLGADECIDYKSEDVAARLKELCPGEIDVMFDNVGGSQLDAALEQARNFSRFVICGSISEYASLGTGAAPTGPQNFGQILMRRITVRGFIALDETDFVAKAYEDIPKMIKAGTLKVDLHPVDAPLEKAPEVWRNLLQGTNDGKLLHVINTGT